ncbi:MAG: PQQ-binding-like beta-propeller repeat protein [Bryobacteraceae bacterium]
MATQDGRVRLRVWPGVAAVAVQWLALFALPLWNPDATVYGLMGAAVCAVAVLVWWTVFSRAPRWERWTAPPFALGVAAVLPRFLDKSITTGMMGLMFLIYAIPSICLALAVWAVVAGRLGTGARRFGLFAAIAAACGAWAIVRTDGVTGAGVSQLTWRWSPTSEERLAARFPAPPPAPGMPSPAVEFPRDEPAPEVRKAKAPGVQAEWPGFRGPRRDGAVRGLRIGTDWASSPPAEVWRRPVGPAWSSFAVAGGLLYTQEQRGESELVTCYRVASGEPVWMHADAVRFWESNAGAGPRATPAFAGGRVYAFGATGLLNALDAATGRLIWRRNAAAEAGQEVPGWGFAGSPLIVDDVVIVAVAGRLAGYDAATGEPRWMSEDGGGGYGSPHVATIDGVRQVILLTGGGAMSVTPADGAALWKHEWKGFASLQPAVVDGGLLIPLGGSMGGEATRRLGVHRAATGWDIRESWTSRGLKPYFNDFVVHRGNAYGFDGSILSCIDLTDGKRRWKGGRYGSGQMLLLADQDLLLVISEEGELALVAAKPDEYQELSKTPAIEGKTWNHPAVAGDLVVVRNAEEMAAFRLAPAVSTAKRGE